MTALRKLPILRKVIERYNFLRSQQPLTKVRDIFTCVIQEVCDLWRKAKIPIRNERAILDNLMSFYQRLRLVNKTSASRKPSIQQQQREKKMSKELSSLFDISSHNCLKDLSRSHIPNWKKTVWAFLIDQRKARKKVMGRSGSIAEESAPTTTTSQSSYVHEVSTTFSSVESQENKEPCNTTIESVECEDGDDENFEQSERKKKKRSPLVSIQIPVAELTRSTTPVADRCGLSIRNQLLFTAGVIVNAGGSTDEIPLSVGSVHRHRQSARERYATEAFNK